MEKEKGAKMKWFCIEIVKKNNFRRINKHFKDCRCMFGILVDFIDVI